MDILKRISKNILCQFFVAQLIFLAALIFVFSGGRKVGIILLFFTASILIGMTIGHSISFLRKIKKENR